MRRVERNQTMAPRRKIPTSFESIDSLMDNLRQLQADAETVLRSKRAARLARGSPQAAEDQTSAGPRKRRTRRRAETETRGGQLRATIERQLTQGLSNVLDRLDLPSRGEVDELSRRVSELEKALGRSSGSRRRD